MKKKERIVVIGASGSIGRQALDVLASACDDFNVVGVAVNTSVNQLSEWLDRFPQIEAVAASGVRNLSIVNVKVFTGERAVDNLLEACAPNVVLIAADTLHALKWTYNALESGARTLVATKEVLALAGDLLVKRFGLQNVVPVDSEMTSLFMLLQSVPQSAVNKLLITASGGRFWRKSLDELESISPTEALKHPRWNMGAKVSIDSAMLTNKVIEAVASARLFGFEPQNIEIFIHPQAFVHAGVLLKSGAAVQLLSQPDMRIAIALSLCGNNATGVLPPFEYSDKVFEFFKPQGWSEQVLALFPEAANNRSKTLALLAADELAIEAFLKRKLSLAQAIRFVLSAFQHTPKLPENPNADTLISAYYELKQLLATKLPK